MKLLHFELTLGPTIMSDRYHITGIRTQLTKNLETVFPALRKEVIDAFNDLIPAGENGQAFPPKRRMASTDPCVSRMVDVGSYEADSADCQPCKQFRFRRALFM